MKAFRLTAFAAVLLVAGIAAALAHGKMNASIPKDGEIVAAGLSEIQLQFSKSLRLTLIHVRHVENQTEIAVRSELPESFVDSARIAVDALQAGSYEVSWTAVSKDGHVMKGSFAFSVKPSLDAQSEQ